MIAPAQFLTRSLRLSPHGPAITRILAAGLDAVHPGEAVGRFVRRENDKLRIADKLYPLEKDRRTFIIAFGKASLPMAESLADILGDRLTGGVVIPKHAVGWTLGLPRVQTRGRLTVMEGGHPVPDERSLAAGQRVLGLLSGLRAGDLLFCLISGGGSALMAAPVAGVTLSDLQSLTSALLACGASVDEINTLRRHLDRLKGGGLARLAAPAQVVALILSDVVGNPLETIASGPTAPNPTTCADALAVLDKYKLSDSESSLVSSGDLYTDYTERTDFHEKTFRKNLCSSVKSVKSVYKRVLPYQIPKNHSEKIPESVMTALRSGYETIKPGDAVFENVDNILVGSNLLAAQAALKQAEAEGFHPYLLRTDLQGEAREVAIELCRTLRWVWQTGDPAPRPACIVAGGETTVTLVGKGSGGRNTELALASVTELADFPDVMLVTLATDGEDGPTDAAGAVVTGETFARAYALGLDPVEYIHRNDSYNFFAALDDLLNPGPTGTNVNDLTFLFTF